MDAQKAMNSIVQDLLVLKETRENVVLKKSKNYQEYLKFRGREQQLSRDINSKFEELEQFRNTSVHPIKKD